MKVHHPARDALGQIAGEDLFVCVEELLISHFDPAEGWNSFHAELLLNQRSGGQVNSKTLAYKVLGFQIAHQLRDQSGQPVAVSV